MATAILEDVRPPMWSIVPAAEPEGASSLHFGRHRIALSNIARVEGETERRRPVDGLFLAAAMFLLCGTLIAFGVFEGGWITRFLIGACFLAFLGTAGLTETFKITTQNLHRVRITLRTGEAVTFATTDLDDAHRLMARITP